MRRAEGGAGDLNSLKRYNIVLNFKPFPFNHVHFYVSPIDTDVTTSICSERSSISPGDFDKHLRILTKITARLYDHKWLIISCCLK